MYYRQIQGERKKKEKKKRIKKIYTFSPVYFCNAYVIFYNVFLEEHCVISTTVTNRLKAQNFRLFRSRRHKSRGNFNAKRG